MNTILNHLNISEIATDFWGTIVFNLFIIALLKIGKQPDYKLTSLVMLEKIDKKLDKIIELEKK